MHEPEHESKMRLLKTHSHTSERRYFEFDNERQENRKMKEALSVRNRRIVKENHRHIN